MHEQLNCREVLPNSAKMHKCSIQSNVSWLLWRCQWFLSQMRIEKFVWLLHGQHYVWRTLWAKKKGFYRLKMAEVAISDTSEALDKDGHAHRAHCKGFCLFLHAAFGLLLLDVAKPSLQVKRLCKNGAQYAQWSSLGSREGSLGVPRSQSHGKLLIWRDPISATHNTTIDVCGFFKDFFISFLAPLKTGFTNGAICRPGFATSC